MTLEMLARSPVSVRSETYSILRRHAERAVEDLYTIGR
jgi:hypothetical protein